MKIKYTFESINDLKRLRKFIEEKNPIAAQRIANEPLSGIKKLKIFPKIGLPVQRAQDPENIRDLFIGLYTVRYLISDKVIYILRIWHGKKFEKTYNTCTWTVKSTVRPSLCFSPPVR